MSENNPINATIMQLTATDLDLDLVVAAKSEVHNISQRRRKRIEPRLRVTCAENLAKIGSVVPEIC